MNPEERITKLEERLALAEGKIAQLEIPSTVSVWTTPPKTLPYKTKVWYGDPLDISGINPQT